jgi:hypothetical protein
MEVIAFLLLLAFFYYSIDKDFAKAVDDGADHLNKGCGCVLVVLGWISIFFFFSIIVSLFGGC